jgi:hypothetical protein
MNYKLHYQNLIRKHGISKRPIGIEGYERHHIIPKSMGGSNSAENLVYLTGRQHVLAHWLLFKIHRNAEMAMAFFIMRANKSNYEMLPTQNKASDSAMQRFGMMTKAVKTPLGIFVSYRDAATAHNIPESTFQGILRAGTPGFTDLGSLRKIAAAAGGEHGMSRRVKTPLGFFPYVGAASAAHGVSNKTIGRRCLENPDEYYYLDPPKQQRTGNPSVNAKECYTPFGIFPSTAAAASAIGVSRETIRSRIRSKSHKYYYFI